MRVFDSAMKGNEYVAEKLSGMSATDGKEGSHRNGPLLVRQIRLERANERCKVFRPRILKDKNIRNVEDDEPRVTGSSVVNGKTCSSRCPLWDSPKSGRSLEWSNPRV